MNNLCPVYAGFIQEKDKVMAAANDMKAAERTYGSFISTLKWTVPLICLIVLLVVIIIA